MRFILIPQRSTRSLSQGTICSLLLLLTTQVRIASTVKCYQCLFHLSRCTNPLDCYNQPDICSNTNFSPINSQVTECEFGCEQYVVTDATGSTVTWRRGCATDTSPRSSHVCFSRNIYFMRHDQCWCHLDYCNSAAKPAGNHLVVISITFSMLFALRIKYL